MATEPIVSTETTPFQFENMSLTPQLARAVSDLNYTEATSIQAAAIPFLLQGQDLIGHSSTGTGKTAAFGIPAVECVAADVKRAQVLVISPTRELALQISCEMQKYAKYKEGVCIATVYGGASMPEQIRQLRRANIVIGTPGRLMDHLRRKTLKMDDLKMVILDEADEMLSMGFIEDIQTILSQAPEERQTVLFSATMPPPILKISKEFLHDPKVIDVMAEKGARDNITQHYYYVAQHQKQEALKLLLMYEPVRSIVFCNTKAMVDEITGILNEQGLKSAGLHGDMTQALRTQVMREYRTGKYQILVATDVAARGIDVDDVDTVINYDIPQSFEYYIHRIGRTGRAGRQGISQTLVCNGKQISTLKSLMRVTGSEITEKRLPSSEQMIEHAVAKVADDLLFKLKEERTHQAELLVSRLLETAGADTSIEDIAYLLADKLLLSKKIAPMPEMVSPDAAKGKRDRGASSASSSDYTPMVTVAASIGRNARVTPNHLVGAIAEMLDISGGSIGKIDIKEDVSFIGMREETAHALLAHPKPIRIKGANVVFSIKNTRDSKPRSGSRSFEDKGKKRTKRMFA